MIKIFTKNFKILFGVFLILLLFNVLILNYIVKSYSVDFQNVSNGGSGGNTFFKFKTKGGWGTQLQGGEQVDDDELLQLNTNFIRFSNMHEKLLLNDGGKIKRARSSPGVPLLLNTNIKLQQIPQNNQDVLVNKKQTTNQKEQDKEEEEEEEKSNITKNEDNKNTDSIDTNTNKEDEIQDKIEKNQKEIERINELKHDLEENEEDEEDEKDEENEEEDEEGYQIDYNNRYRYPSKPSKRPTNKKLLIVIPTLPREGGIENDHLSSILNSFEDQSKDINPLSGLDIKVLVFNNSPKRHPIFTKLKEHYRYKFKDIFSFKDNPSRVVETATSPSDDELNLSKNETTFKMRQKNLDITKMLKSVQGEADYVMVMEDDFPICSSSVSVLPYILKKSGLYNPNWDLIKTSIGLNGMVFKSKSINRVTHYLEHNRKYKPIELLLSEWMCGMREIGDDRISRCNESKRNSIIFRLTLFSHINGASTFKRDSASIQFPHCWYDYTHLLPLGDRFYVKQCSDDDIAPCVQYDPIKSMITDLSEVAHLNHYIKAKITISPTTKRNISIEVSFIQRELSPIYKATSILEEIHNFSTTSAANRHINNKFFDNDNGDTDTDTESNISSFNAFTLFISNLIHGLLIFILASVIILAGFTLYKKIKQNSLISPPLLIRRD